jgi:hypothetical protein
MGVGRWLFNLLYRMEICYENDINYMEERCLEYGKSPFQKRENEVSFDISSQSIKSFALFVMKL